MAHLAEKRPADVCSEDDEPAETGCKTGHTFLPPTITPTPQGTNTRGRSRRRAATAGGSFTFRNAPPLYTLMPFDQREHSLVTLLAVCIFRTENYSDLRKTPLFFAVSNGDLTCAKVLLAAGARTDLDPLRCVLVAVRAERCTPEARRSLSGGPA